MDRGVGVTIVTRKVAPNTETARLIKEIKAAGASVHEQQYLHEKLAFIDDQVAWFGSLNILSQRSSTEQMMGFNKPDLVIKLMELSGIGLSGGQGSGHWGFLGSAMVNSVATKGSLSTQIRPPCRATTSRARARPTPMFPPRRALPTR